MTETSYYKTTSDFTSEPNAANISICNVMLAINNSSIATPLKYVNKVNDNFEMRFYDALSAGDVTKLNNLISNYTIVVCQNKIGGIFETYAQGTNGGTFTSGAWQTRALNTLTGNVDFMTLDPVTHQFTINPGKYAIEIHCNAYGVNAHKIRLYNVTESQAILYGDNAIATCSGDVCCGNASFIAARLAIGKPTVYKVEHYCATTKATNGFGVACNISGVAEMYASIAIVYLEN